MLRTHKIQLLANKKQEHYFVNAAGVSRDAYNWALTEWKKAYESGEKTSEVDLRRKYNAIKRVEKPWALDVTKVAPQQAIKNLGTAFKNAFARYKKGIRTGSKKNPYGFPQYKKKFKNDSFRADNGPSKKGEDAVKVIGKYITLPKIGKIKMAEKLRFSGQVKSTTVSRIADRWFVSISVDTIAPKIPSNRQEVVGVDLGVKTLATFSTGTIKEIDNPRGIAKKLKHLRRLNKNLSRTKKGSKNRIKAILKLAKQHARISNLRKDVLHKATHYLVNNFKVIGIEDLDVKGMLKNKKLSRKIADVGFYEFKRQLEYKSKLYDSELIINDRFYPSSKTCNVCKRINTNLHLSTRVWTCQCGAVLHRDNNASLNMEQITRESSSRCNACGDESAGSVSLLTE